MFCPTQPYSLMRLFCLLLCLFAAPLLDATAQTTTPLPLERLHSPVRLDGLSDEPAWQAIAPVPLTMSQPSFQGTMTERSEIRFAYDDTYLYAAARFYDSDPTGVRANSLARDGYNGDDLFSIFIDTFNDNENGLWFFATPGGVRYDAAISGDGNRSNASWNTFWDAATVQNEDGWFAEVRIPFSSLGFQNLSDRVVMGLAAWRLIARKNEYQTFPALSPNRSLLTPSRTQDVVLEGIQAQTPIYVTPYALGGMGQTARLNAAETGYAMNNDLTQDVGLDVKVNLTSNLTLDATLNTDFAQAEADNQQVNLTRFSLFFPEKRQFFQERAGLFAFNTSNERLFHSRRIGLHNGQAIPILGGTRLVGKVGVWDVGFIDMQTARSGDLPSENFGVARMRRQVFNSNSFAGGIVTSRIGMDGSYNLAYGLDGVFRLFGDEYLLLNWAQTFDDALIDQETFEWARAGLLQARWERRRNAGWSYYSTLTWSGEDFLPDLGFFQRRNYTALNGLLHYNRYPGEHSVFQRTMFFHVDGEVALRNTDGSTESVWLRYMPMVWFKRGNSIMLATTVFYEDLRGPLSFVNQSTVAAGSYTFYTVNFSYGMSNRRRVRASVNASAGSFYDGTRYDVGIRPSWTPSQHFQVSGSYSLNRVRFADRDEGFDAHLVGLQTQVALNTHLSANAFMQYNSAFHIVTGNVRVRYNFREGSDLWIVYNEGLNTNRERLVPVLPISNERTILLKYTYTFDLKNR